MTRMTPERQERIRRREQQLLNRGEKADDVARMVLEEELEADRVAASLAGQVLFAFADLARYAQLSRAFVPDAATGKNRRVTASEAALGWAELVERYPAAVFHIEVPLSAVWRPPPEPRDQHWHVTKAGRARYREEVAVSLQDHLNAALRHLSYCVRTGRWWRLTAATMSVKGEEVEERGAAWNPLGDPRPTAWRPTGQRGGSAQEGRRRAQTAKDQPKRRG